MRTSSPLDTRLRRLFGHGCMRILPYHHANSQEDFAGQPCRIGVERQGEALQRIDFSLERVDARHALAERQRRIACRSISFSSAPAMASGNSKANSENVSLGHTTSNSCPLLMPVMRGRAHSAM
jgi:hypothetical protein